MEKALELLKQMRNYFGSSQILVQAQITEALDELEALQEENKILKHNYDVQVEYNNTAYKNYTNMVNLLEQRIEDMKPKTCEGCRYINIVKYVQVVDETIECCAVCIRQGTDYYEPKDNS